MFNPEIKHPAARDVVPLAPLSLRRGHIAMSTPSENTVPVSYFDPRGLGPASPMLFGIKWGGPVGTGVSLTWSMASTQSWWADGYSGANEPAQLVDLTIPQQQAIGQAINCWGAVCNVTFQQVPDNQFSVGEIRFGASTAVSDSAFAYAYYPASQPVGGDVWFNPTYSNVDYAPGSYGYMAAVHEVGHALGLTHSFDLPDAYDNFFYSIMSYTTKEGQTSNWASFYPTTPMYYDLLAIQSVYGRNTHANAGNTTYTFDGGTYWQTIDDASGKDTIRYTGTLDTTIDLREGQFSSLSAPIQFADYSTSRFTVAIGPGTRIENATGASGADILIGNGLANVLTGNGGTDTLYGNGGNDTLIGGTGKDLLYGGAGADIFLFRGKNELGSGANRDVIADFERGKDHIDLRGLIGHGPAPHHAGDSHLNGAGPDWTIKNRHDITLVQIDLDCDGKTDWQIELAGLIRLTGSDFLV